MKVHPKTFVIIDDDPELVRAQSEFIRSLGHQAYGLIVGIRDESDGLASVAEKVARINPHVIVIDCDFFSSPLISGTKLLQRLEREYWGRNGVRKPLVLASSGKPSQELINQSTAVFKFKHDLLEKNNILLSWHRFAEIIDVLSRKAGVRSSLLPESAPQAA